MLPNPLRATAHEAGLAAEHVAGRTMLLFDPGAEPQSWNERMSPQEYAVLYAGVAPDPALLPGDGNAPAQPFCTVFPSLEEAQSHAQNAVHHQPELVCRVYDGRGLASQPLFESRGKFAKAESDISPRFRRWVGSILFFGGLLLTGIDWLADFRYFWPSMVGTRMIPTGLVLLVIELGIQLNHWDGRRRARLRP